MKIICTKAEMDNFIECIVKSSLCPFDGSVDCPVEICRREQCMKCANEKIKWEIEDGE